MEDTKYPNCSECHVVIDLWKDAIIIDAYQKDWINHYSYLCPICKNEQSISIPIEDSGEYTPTFKGFFSDLWKVMFSKSPPVAQ